MKIYIARYNHNIVPGAFNTLTLDINQPTKSFVVTKVIYCESILNLTTNTRIPKSQNTLFNVVLTVTSLTTNLAEPYLNTGVPAGGNLLMSNTLQIYEAGIYQFEETYISNYVRLQYAYENLSLVDTLRISTCFITEIKYID
jgi:hypothetical protein